MMALEDYLKTSQAFARQAEAEFQEVLGICLDCGLPVLKSDDWTRATWNPDSPYRHKNCVVRNV